MRATMAAAAAFKLDPKHHSTPTPNRTPRVALVLRISSYEADYHDNLKDVSIPKGLYVSKVNWTDVSMVGRHLERTSRPLATGVHRGARWEEEYIGTSGVWRRERMVVSCMEDGWLETGASLLSSYILPPAGPVVIRYTAQEHPSWWHGPERNRLGSTRALITLSVHHAPVRVSRPDQRAMESRCSE
jgi:hypothetical protein